MSKKNSKQQQKAEEVIDLANLKVAETVTVMLPPEVDNKKTTAPLL